ncbi:MAG: hypothetical protein EOO73_01965 [Myxococcales bacterium]|nr:MAG: hypothetical protein EOO73_01965 [Myxococcales bacterium]
MTSRFIALFACGLGLAVACGADDDKTPPPLEEAGGAPADAGAPAASGAGSSGAPGGEGGIGGTADTGGEPSVAGGAAGAPSSAGASGGGGAPIEPGASACGTKKYETGEGCAACPALPIPNDVTTLSCQDNSRAYKNDSADLELSFALVPFHEPLSGQVFVTWEDTLNHNGDGEGDATFTYSPSAGQFLIDLPDAARYANAWRFGAWSFTDACGFLFSAPALSIEAEGDTFGCDDPT